MVIPVFALYVSYNLSSEGPTSLFSVFAVQHMENYRVIEILLQYFLKVHLSSGEVESTKHCQIPSQAWVALETLCWPVQITTKCRNI